MALQETSLSTCYLVRHGQRLDAVDKSHNWFQKNPHRYPLDPPLTERGSDMAAISAQRFLELHPDIKLSCVYSSPLHRAFMTAKEFAKALQLPLVIVPGLACAEAVKVFGPIITKADGTMALKKKLYGRRGKLLENVFLTLEEVQEMCPNIEVTMRKDLMGGIDLNEFEQVVHALAREDREKEILVVAHREGIYHFLERLDKELKRANYCQIVRIELDTQKQIPRSLEVEFKGLLT